MGVVYEAFDRERGQAVALKSLSRVDANGIYRLKKEFRSLADVVHPNLVALYDLVSSGSSWFFTMELVHGHGFIDYVHGKTRVESESLSPPWETSSLRQKDRPAEARMESLPPSGRLPAPDVSAESPTCRGGAPGSFDVISNLAPVTRVR